MITSHTRDTAGPGVLTALPETGDERLDDVASTLALDGFADAAAAHGRRAAAAAITAAFPAAPVRQRALMLDLAERHALRCLPVHRVVDDMNGHRALRHATLRYLSQCAGTAGAAEAVAAARDRAEDRYEHTLATICLARLAGMPPADPMWTIGAPERAGLTVAQSVPDTGALAALLRHLGTVLPGRAGIARVVTLDLLGRDEDAGRTALAQGASHVVVRLPVDAVRPVRDDLPRHRAALAFMARQLLWLAGCLPDVVHVWSADDGAAAVADAAQALGARTVVTPGADGPGHHRHTADRLVAAADALVEPPGPSGTEQVAARLAAAYQHSMAARLGRRS